MESTQNKQYTFAKEQTGSFTVSESRKSAFHKYTRPQIKKNVSFKEPEPKPYFYKLTQQEILDNFNSTNYEDSYLALELKFNRFCNPKNFNHAKHR